MQSSSTLSMFSESSIHMDDVEASTMMDLDSRLSSLGLGFESDDTDLQQQQQQHRRIVSEDGVQEEGEDTHHLALRQHYTEQRAVETSFEPLVNIHDKNELDDKDDDMLRRHCFPQPPTAAMPRASSFGERDRFHHLENSCIHLPEPGKVDRPALGMIRASRLDPLCGEGEDHTVSLSESGLMADPSTSCAAPKVDDTKLPPGQPTTLLSAAHLAYLAGGADVCSSDSEMMRSDEFVEQCQELFLSQHADDINNNSKEMNPLNKSSEKMFSSKEFATLCKDFPTLLGQPAMTAQQQQQQPMMPVLTSADMGEYNHPNSLSDNTTLHAVQHALFDDAYNIYINSINRPIASSAQVQQNVQHQGTTTEVQLQQHQQPDAVVIPTERDVKCGRGGDTIQHNAHFIDLCEAMADSYAATRTRGMEGKQGIVLGIVHAIQEKQGRFLKRSSANGGGGAPTRWQVLSIKDAENKTSHCIRDILKRRREQAEGEQTA